MMTKIFVCIACRPRERGEAVPASGEELPGLALAEALEARLAGRAEVDIERVECLAVCRRPATIALAAGGKWTYIVGDLAGEDRLADHIEDIAAAAAAYGASENGIIPWRERPQSFRKGVIARLPPLPAAAGEPIKDNIAC
jgi:predicted metal-binding protein